MKKLPANLKKLIKLLSDGNYHQGSDLGKTLKITRSAIWKFTQQLKQLGIKINSEKARGYCMEEPVILLNANTIKKKFDAPDQQFMLEILDTTTSTNDHLKKITPKNQVHFCLAEQQTAGRGRLGRNWHSPFGVNIYLSCSWPFQKDLSQLSGLSLVVGLAVIEALKHFTPNESLKIKWPNDILWNHQKLAGILLEITAESNGFSNAIIGIGININSSKQTQDLIDQPWVSLHEITKNYFDRNELAAQLIKQLLLFISEFSKNGLEPFLDLWKQHDALINQSIQFKQGKEENSGTVMGIDKQGYLLIKKSDGHIESYSAGDTTLAKSHTP